MAVSMTQAAETASLGRPRARQAWLPALAALLAIGLGVGIVVSPARVIGFSVLAIGGLLTVRTIRKVRRQAGERPDKLFLEVAAIPMALAITPGNTTIAAGLAVALAVAAHVRLPGRSFTVPLILAVGAAAPVSVLGKPGVHFLIFIGVAYAASRGADRRNVVASFLDGIAVYLIANIVAYFALGLRSPTAATRIGGLESGSGLFSQRIIFPFTESVVTPPVLACAFIIGVIPLIFVSETRRTFRLVGIFAGALVLIAANYRVPLAVAAILGVLIVTAPRFTIRAAPVVAVLALFLPYSYATVSNTTNSLIEMATSSIPSLARDERSNGTLNGRTVIWEVTRDRQANFGIKRQLFGWGPHGQIPSEVSRGYAYVFKGGFTEPTGAGSHNSALQQLLDGGWIGLALLVAALWTTLQALGRWARSSPYGLAALGMVLSVAITAGTEGVLAPGPYPLGFVVLVVAAAVAPWQRRRAKALQVQTVSV